MANRTKKSKARKRFKKWTRANAECPWGQSPFRMRKRERCANTRIVFTPNPSLNVFSDAVTRGEPRLS